MACNTRLLFIIPACHKNIFGSRLKSTSCCCHSLQNGIVLGSDSWNSAFSVFPTDTVMNIFRHLHISRALRHLRFILPGPGIYLTKWCTMHIATPGLFLSSWNFLLQIEVHHSTRHLGNSAPSVCQEWL